jgi:hypothetical protein
LRILGQAPRPDILPNYYGQQKQMICYLAGYRKHIAFDKAGISLMDDVDISLRLQKLVR